MPAPALERLRQVEIWAETEMPKTACMCYHVSKRWLVPNGYNPDKEGTVEIGNAVAFLRWTKHQPWMVLHELAHGYHHRVLGYGHAGIRAAHGAAKKAGIYDEVLHIDGSKRRHYALTNPQEYFAEATEAYFGTNDFYPFVRSELQQHDDRGGRGPNPTPEVGTPARGVVERARFMGGESLVEFRMEFDGSLLKARVPSVFLPKVGTALWLMVRRDRCFVFPS